MGQVLWVESEVGIKLQTYITRKTQLIQWIRSLGWWGMCHEVDLSNKLKNWSYSMHQQSWMVSQSRVWSEDDSMSWKLILIEELQIYKKTRKSRLFRWIRSPEWKCWNPRSVLIARKQIYWMLGQTGVYSMSPIPVWRWRITDRVINENTSWLSWAKDPNWNDCGSCKSLN